MADGTGATAAVSDDPPTPEEPGADGDGGLTDAQAELLEKCLNSLKHAKNDSHTLAALLLVRLGNRGYNRTFRIDLKGFLRKNQWKKKIYWVSAALSMFTLGRKCKNSSNACSHPFFR